MTMSLIYVPCMAAIAIIKRETNSWKWTGFVLGYTLVLCGNNTVILLFVLSLRLPVYRLTRIR